METKTGKVVKKNDDGTFQVLVHGQTTPLAYVKNDNNLALTVGQEVEIEYRGPVLTKADPARITRLL